MRHPWWAREPTKSSLPSLEFDVSRLPRNERAARRAIPGIVDLPVRQGLLVPGRDSILLQHALGSRQVDAIASGLVYSAEGPEPDELATTWTRRVLDWLLGRGASEHRAEQTRSGDVPSTRDLVERIADIIATSVEGPQMARDLSEPWVKGQVQSAGWWSSGENLARVLTGTEGGRTLARDVEIHPPVLDPTLQYRLNRSSTRALHRQMAEEREPIIIAQALAAGAEGHHAARTLADNDERLWVALKLAHSPGGQVITSFLVDDDVGPRLATHLALSDEGLDLVDRLIRTRQARVLASRLAGSGTSRAVARNLSRSGPGLTIETMLAGSRRGRRYLNRTEFGAGGLMLTMAVLPVVNMWCGLRVIVVPAVVWYAAVALTRLDQIGANQSTTGSQD